MAFRYTEDFPFNTYNSNEISATLKKNNVKGRQFLKYYSPPEESVVQTVELKGIIGNKVLR